MTDTVYSHLCDAFADAVLELDLRGTHEDHGIGTYEYWGALGNDSQWATTIETRDGLTRAVFLLDHIPTADDIEESQTTEQWVDLDVSLPRGKHFSSEEEYYDFMDGVDTETEVVAKLCGLHIQPLPLADGLCRVEIAFTWETNG